MDTTNLDDLLNQAEAHEQNQNNWQMDLRYESKEFYIDEHGTVEIRNKTIGDMSKHISVKGESYSQYIEFKTNRFYDGVDLTKMLLSIYFEIPNVGSDENRPVNVYYNDNEIKFGWAIPDVVSQKSSTLNLCIYARGKLEDGKTYLLKTKTTKYTINEGLDIGSGIIEPTENWYLDFVLQMDEKVAQASENADKAVQAASSIDGAVETVTTARNEVVQKASTVDTQHSEVESWHQESEQFRNEAEQFRNQAEAITGIGLAEEGKPGIVQPDGVTTKVDADGKLTVIGGGGASEEAIRALEEFTQQLDQDISTLDTELEQTNQQLQSTTDKVDDVQESIEAGFKKQAQGEAIHTTDAVDGKLVEFALFGKAKQQTTQGNQLLDLSGFTTMSGGGVTFTNNGDGSLKMVGTPNDSSGTLNVWFAGRWNVIPSDDDSNVLFTLKAGKKYYIRDCVLYSATADNPNKQIGSGIKNITEDFKVTGVRNLGVSPTQTYNTIIYPMVAESDVEVPFEPYTGGIPSPNPDYLQEIETAGASGSVEVKSVGKNLLNYPDTVVPANNHWLKGDFPTNVSSIGAFGLYLKKGTYVVSFDSNVSKSNAVAFSFFNTFGDRIIQITGALVQGRTSLKVTLSEDSYALNGYANTDVTISNIQLEEGTTATEYEPYKETVATIPTPNGLPGIKVDSGGNYTDENGQQWITDEIIRYADGSGEYIQKTLKKRALSSLNWTYSTTTHRFWADDRVFEFGKVGSFYPNAICTHFSKMEQTDYDTDLAFSYINQITGGYAYRYLALNGSIDAWKTFLDENEVYVLGVLANPIITPLTPEQITEIEKLYTFSPVTNISNDAECGMEVTYATLQEALMLQEAYNQSKENAQEVVNVKEEIVDVKQDLSDTTSRVESIEERTGLGITETASGEEIHLIDSAEGKAVEFALYGKAKQNTTTGKNLIESVEKLNWSINSEGTQLEKDSVNKKVIITTNGISNYSGIYIYPKEEMIGKNCTVSADITISSGSKIKFGLNDGMYIDITANQKTRLHHTVTVESKAFAIYSGEEVAKTITVENLQIEYGEVATPFEEYTGGATPRPDYPQEIEVSGESYNLLENTATSQTIDSVEFVVNEDKSITVNGTATKNLNFIISELPNLPNEKLILSGCKDGSTTTYYLAYTNYTDKAYFDLGEGIEISKFDYTSYPNSKVQIEIKAGTTFNNVVFKPMIRKASVTNDSYMPYGVDRVEVKSVGKNKLNIETSSRGLLDYSNGVVASTNLNWLTSDFIEVDSQNISIYTNNVSDNFTVRLCEYNSLREFIKCAVNPTGVLGNETISLVLDSKTKYIRVSYGFNNKNTTVDSYIASGNVIQVEEGTKVTPYQPYKETLSTIPTENGLAGIDDVCDEKVKYADGSGEKVQRFAKAKIKDLSWAYDGSKMYSATLDGIKANGLSNLLCTNMIVSVDGNYIRIRGDNSYGYLYVYNSPHTNAVDFVNAYGEGEILYQLATPIHTPLTAEEIAEIEKLHTFYPVTNISNDFDCGMKIEYVCDSIITTNTEIPIVEQDGELESGDNIVTLFGKIKRMLENLNSRLSTLEQNSKTIVYSDTEPETVEENTIVMVYETEE